MPFRGRLTCWFCNRVLTRSSGKTQVTPMIPAMPPFTILGTMEKPSRATAAGATVVVPDVAAAGAASVAAAAATSAGTSATVVWCPLMLAQWFLVLFR